MTLEKIISKIQEQLKDGIYPGASLALYQASRWQEFYFGLADPQEGKATQAGLVYDLASVSKVVGVGTLAAFLYEQDKLELDLPLQHYYPAFHREDVTLRQLLTHTSGLDPFIPNRDQLTAPELKAALNHLTVLEDKTFRYTDVNFLLLGFMWKKSTVSLWIRFFKVRFSGLGVWLRQVLDQFQELCRPFAVSRMVRFMIPRRVCWVSMLAVLACFQP